MTSVKKCALPEYFLTVYLLLLPCGRYQEAPLRDSGHVFNQACARPAQQLLQLPPFGNQYCTLIPMPLMEWKILFLNGGIVTPVWNGAESNKPLYWRIRYYQSNTRQPCIGHSDMKSILWRWENAFSICPHINREIAPRTIIFVYFVPLCPVFSWKKKYFPFL